MVIVPKCMFVSTLCYSANSCHKCTDTTILSTIGLSVCFIHSRSPVKVIIGWHARHFVYFVMHFRDVTLVKNLTSNILLILTHF